MTKLIKALCNFNTVQKMNSLSKYSSVIVVFLVFLSLLTGCTGINDKQLGMDPVYSEAERVRESLTLKRAEFHQLEQEYVMTLHPAHMRRMEELIKFVREDLVVAAYLQKHFRYYRKGLDNKRWTINQQTYNLCQKTLCQMLFSMGELQMIYNDKKKAAEIFDTLIKEFTDEMFSEYVAMARNHLKEIGSNNQFFLSEKLIKKDSN